MRAVEANAADEQLRLRSGLDLKKVEVATLREERDAIAAQRSKELTLKADEISDLTAQLETLRSIQVDRLDSVEAQVSGWGVYCCDFRRLSMSPRVSYSCSDVPLSAAACVSSRLPLSTNPSK